MSSSTVRPFQPPRASPKRRALSPPTTTTSPTKKLASDPPPTTTTARTPSKKLDKQPTHPRKGLSKEEIQKELAEVQYWYEHPDELLREVLADDPTYNTNPRLPFPDDDTLAAWEAECELPNPAPEERNDRHNNIKYER